MMVIFDDYRLDDKLVIFHGCKRCRYFMKMCQFPVIVWCQFYVLFDDVENDEFIIPIDVWKVTKSDQKWCQLSMCFWCVFVTALRVVKHHVFDRFIGEIGVKTSKSRKVRKKVAFLFTRIMADLRPLYSQTLGKSPEAKKWRFLGSISYYIYSGIGSQLEVTEYLPSRTRKVT
jgi:hypothetical protein